MKFVIVCVGLDICMVISWKVSISIGVCLVQ